LKREIITTGDGSKTIRIEEWNEQYHSIHGAKQESLHVFIKHGLNYITEELGRKKISVLEYGFGTGLNAYLTANFVSENGLSCKYVGLEAFPLSTEEIKQLNYSGESTEADINLFHDLHRSEWEKPIDISEGFALEKRKIKFQDFHAENEFDLIYYDAFGARVQPELWTRGIFEVAYGALKSRACLVTYSSKGTVKRAMQDCGFRIEKLQGPPGKRHMIRAVKGF